MGGIIGIPGIMGGAPMGGTPMGGIPMGAAAGISFLIFFEGPPSIKVICIQYSRNPASIEREEVVWEPI
jgi:hypothetical protein